MSTTGRYQSRFLNFLSQQSQRLGDQVGRTTRQLQMAALLGAQVILYPLYLIFQGTRLVGQQLKEAIRQGTPQIRAFQDPILPVPITRDRPIWQILTALQQSPGFQLEAFQLHVPSLIYRPQLSGNSSFPLASGTANTLVQGRSDASNPAQGKLETVNSNLPFQEGFGGSNTIEASMEGCELGILNIQGVASLLENRNLILVDEQNQIWDVLSTAQQKYLYQRIIWELIDYYRSLKLTHLLGEGNSLPSPKSTPLPLASQTPAALLPLQKFQDLIAWLQQGSVAMSINLFGEAELAGLLALQREFFPQGWFKLSGTELQLLPPSEIPLQQLDFPPANSHLLDVLANWSLQTTQVGLATPQLPSTDSWLSMEDLFGAPTLIVDEMVVTSVVARQASETLEPDAPASEDPWLSMEDLFGEQAATIAVPIPETIPTIEQPIGWTLPALTLASLTPTLSEQLPQLEDAEDATEKAFISSASSVLSLSQFHPIQSDQPEEEDDSAAIVEEPSEIRFPETSSTNSLPLPGGDRQAGHPPHALPSSRSGALTHSNGHQPRTQSKKSQLKHTPDWIDTNAKATGYVKHPLEYMMEWLDQIILWLEEVGILIWQSIRRLWRGVK